MSVAAAPVATPTVTSAEVDVRSGPLPALVKEVHDVYFGRDIVDPYRWMESDTPDFVAWMKAEAAYARAELDKLEPLATLGARVKELDNAVAKVDLPSRTGEKVFYLKSEVGTDAPKLYTRDRISAPERLLVDPDKLAEPGKHATIDYFKPSPDGHHVVYGVSQSGSETSVIHVIEAATGRPLPDVIDRARYAHPSWRDGHSFFYRRGPKAPPDTPAAQRLNRGRIYLHELGRDPDTDSVVFGYGVSPAIPMSDDSIPVVEANRGAFIVAYIEAGVADEVSLFVARATELHGDKTPWRQIVSPSDEVTDFAVRGDQIYLLSHKDAPRFKLLRVKLPQADLSKASVVLAESEVVLDAIGAASDALYLRTIDGGIGHLVRIPYDPNAKPEAIAVPDGGSVAKVSTDVFTSGVLVGASSWTKAPIIYVFDTKTKKLEDSELSQPSPIAFTDIVTEEVKARSADGTMVPLSILRQKDLARDGSHPTWLRGYGAYSNIWDPRFEPMNLAWLERGGVIAVCHPRGGGEYGDAWHRGGQLATKPNTIADFLACAHELVDEKLTSPAHLGGEGTSAGGILIGGAITAEPELFGAAVIRVGMNNALRFEQIPIGPFNTSEFGSVKTEEGFRSLLAIDAFHRVKDKTAYPAVLLTTGITDGRVSPWQSAKLAARLRAASTSGKPVLLRVDFESGHGIGSSRSQIEAERADELAFLLSRLSGH